ncbi:unnamed protein product [Ectocarpus sp. CCAP 1310/34]|nr:unnamed protein product [Ectocarpus sp. CCAP 1310/34]
MSPNAGCCGQQKAAELTDKVLKHKREQWQKAQQRSGGSSRSSGVRRTADSAVADPVITALRGGGRTRSRVQTSEPAEQETAPVNWRQHATETFLASMDSMGYENALLHLEKIGSTFAKDTLVRLRELEAKASTAVSLERVIEQAQMQRRTIEGRHTLQTILTAAAFPVDVDGAPSISARRRAAVLGVQERAFTFAAERAKKLLSDLHPTEVIKRGVYWFWPRAKRSDAASEELLELMRQYRHTDEVSRQHCNSAERDMWKASKSPTAHRHPRRQLAEPGGGDAVYAKFLNWASYKSFKERQSEDFADPGRTLFLSTRCKCLVLPAMEQCACKIHSQCRRAE